ncbi:hypothetical protein AB0I60_20995 [Actinosynnema sp. NPDC050436]|uniref:hypothetical protein n=1 Tax=Actinosynnema sp. NPDC050436 TaxID=3155659 RepID=UPI0033EC9AA6
MSAAHYRLINFRDVENDAGVDADDALLRSYTDVVAATDYELFIQCTQDLLPVAVDVEVWPGPPPPVDGSWSEAQVFTLDFPSGAFFFGSPTGAVVDGGLPEGPGYYTLDVVHRGREEAAATLRRVLGHEDIAVAVEEVRGEHPDGVEQYLIRLWRTGDLPEDEYAEWDEP